MTETFLYKAVSIQVDVFEVHSGWTCCTQIDHRQQVNNCDGPLFSEGRAVAEARYKSERLIDADEDGERLFFLRGTDTLRH